MPNLLGSSLPKVLAVPIKVIKSNTSNRYTCPFIAVVLMTTQAIHTPNRVANLLVEDQIPNDLQNKSSQHATLNSILVVMSLGN